MKIASKKALWPPKTTLLLMEYPLIWTSYEEYDEDCKCDFHVVFDLSSGFEYENDTNAMVGVKLFLKV